ncbi:transmembrane protein, putative (macronuclear) [Tetrahymena thermophila SB210]|uniref:Transmembrane protein, putative n=1 Tax=Tetrahymena thermophila (strain SB210) TaxID=312017 RepID=Q23JF2_TETTS|nr:transmembrane protein, putative [Tetrahymena thermophila SB210]EAR96552.2 transmembrane protein, putative [Tetrahymena thermophila SB210]|eukprot:XP_001016797.2 transmembrane protein, putative [Tetrahymena thermophila SB210]
MKIFQLDLFSSGFYFNLDGQNYKKGTVQGVALSLASLILVISYFIYLLDQYINNQIEPQFRSQSFITDSRKEIQLDEDLIAFQFYYNSSLTISQYEALQNKTYLVFQAYFYYYDPQKNINQIINLDIIQCTNAWLQGQNCIDFSQIRNYSLILDNNNNIFSQLYISVYGCLDLDNIKTVIPNNCGLQSEIDAIINGSASGVSMSLKTQQYNTTSMQIQTNYRFIYSYSTSSQYIITNLKAQMQETQVKQGLIIQEQKTYTSPIYYDQTMFSLDRQLSLQQGIGPYNQITVQMDEYVQYVNVQYATITQILALVNSVATVIMVCRVLGIYVSQKLIKQDFFILIMRNLFLEKCQQILQNNSQITQNCQLYIQSQSKEGNSKKEQNEETDEFTDDISENQNKKDIVLPSFQFKYLQNTFKSKSFFNDSSCSSKQKQLFDDEQQFKDEVKDTLSQFSLKNQSQVCNNMTNYSKIDKINQIAKNEFHLDKQINNGIFDKEKQLNFTQQKFFQKQIDFEKKDLKVDLKSLQNKNQKNFGDVISQKLKVMNSSQMKQSIQNTIFNFKCLKSKFLQSKGIKQKEIKKIDQEVQKNLNINEFFKDIIFLKKAVCMLLSLDQIAAIQLVSLTDNFTNLDLEGKDSKVNYELEKVKLNHFEKQFSVLQCEQLQLYYIEKFLIRYQEGNYLNDVDKRIISSIQKKANE